MQNGQVKKVYFADIPAVIREMLAEQLGFFSALEVTLELHNSDIVIADKHVGLSGRPLLRLTQTQDLRMGNILRRLAQMLAEPALHIDDVSVAGHTFRPREKLWTHDDGRETPLTGREVDILVYLLRRAGGCVTRDELLRNVWRYQEGIDTHTLETHIYRLRQKIEKTAEDPNILVTEENGYILKGIT